MDRYHGRLFRGAHHKCLTPSAAEYVVFSDSQIPIVSHTKIESQVSGMQWHQLKDKIAYNKKHIYCQQNQ